MKVIILKGHERSITFVKYNREGDLLFSMSKDKFPTLWMAGTGERIGTYVGHQGAVWHCDVTYDSRLLATGAADASARLWDVETGKSLAEYSHDRPVRAVSFAHGTRQLVTCSDQVMGTAPKLRVFDLAVSSGGGGGGGGGGGSGGGGAAASSSGPTTPVLEIEGWSPNARITAAAWGPNNETILAAGSDGHLAQYDPRAPGKVLQKIKAHGKSIRSFAFDDNVRQLCVITGSNDTFAKIWDARTLKLLKTFDTGRSINCVSISPLMDHVMLAGGQEAVDVALTRVDPAQFHVRIYHKLFAEELGQISGHFGPVNTLAYSPDGRAATSGGEDGYVRIHHLDSSYLDALSDERIEAARYTGALR